MLKTLKTMGTAELLSEITIEICKQFVIIEVRCLRNKNIVYTYTDVLRKRMSIDVLMERGTAKYQFACDCRDKAQFSNCTGFVK